MHQSNSISNQHYHFYHGGGPPSSSIAAAPIIGHPLIAPVLRPPLIAPVLRPPLIAPMLRVPPVIAAPIYQPPKPKERFIHVIKIKNADGTYETKVFVGAQAQKPANELVPGAIITKGTIQRTLVPANVPLGASAGLQDALANVNKEESYVPGEVSQMGGINLADVPVYPYEPQEPLGREVPEEKNALPSRETEPEKEANKNEVETEEIDEVVNDDTPQKDTFEEPYEEMESDLPEESETPPPEEKKPRVKETNYLLQSLQREQTAMKKQLPQLYQADRLAANGFLISSFSFFSIFFGLCLFV